MPPFDDRGYGAAYGVELRGRYEIVAPQKLGVTFGTESTYYRTNSRSFTEGDAGCAPTEDAACVPKNFGIEGVYTEVDGQPTPWLGFTGGVRFDDNSVVQKNVSPRVALFVSKPEHYGVKLLYAEGFRNPSAYEAFFFDNVSFAQPVNLGAETIQSYEAVAWAKPTGGLSLRLSAFYWDATQIVEQLPDPDERDAVAVPECRPARQRRPRGRGQLSNGRRLVRVRRRHVRERRRRRSGHAGRVRQRAQRASPHGGGRPVDAEDLRHRAPVGRAQYIGQRATRVDDTTGAAGPVTPGWVGLNGTIYIPNVSHFDITAGVRNILGTRDLVPAPGDYDSHRRGADADTSFRVPGEGREFYVEARLQLLASRRVGRGGHRRSCAPAFAQRPNQAEDDSAALVEEGRARSARGKLDAAAKALDQAISLNPRRVEAYVVRAGVYAARKQYKDGIELLRKAQALAPLDSRRADVARLAARVVRR